jgi:hypothetical protein
MKGLLIKTHGAGRQSTVIISHNLHHEFSPEIKNRDGDHKSKTIPVFVQLLNY